MKTFRRIFGIVATLSLILAFASACILTDEKDDDTFSYLVLVQEKGTSNIIENATVFIEVKGKAPLIGPTDTYGYARIFVEAAYAGQPGNLRVDAQGYEPYRRGMDISKDALPDVIYLVPENGPQPTNTSFLPILLLPTPAATETATALPPTATPLPTSPTAKVVIILPSETPGSGSALPFADVKGVRMALVPAGDFLMGSANSDPDAGENEKPQRSVYLDAFYIDVNEVTNALYATCVAQGGCPQKPECLFYYNDPAYANHPVVCVDWEQANTYCKWRDSRLPSEAEWEKAARGTDGRLYPWGNNAPTCSLANYSGCVGDTRVVGSYPSGGGPYGVFDMAGNVWEWVQDWYSHTTYVNPLLRNPTGPGSGTVRALRGGSRTDHAWSMRTTNRNGLDPGTRNNTIGFRCARTP